MAGDLRTILDAIRVRMDSLGFKATDKAFDFDAVPDSLMDRAYRIETRLLESTPILGNRAVTAEELAVFVAYKLKRKDADALDAALDDREKIERDIVNDATVAALAQRPILRLAGDSMAVKYLDNYLVSKTVLRCDYDRDIS